MATGLLFSGQGAQIVGMGHSLYENSDTARAIFDEANEVLGWDLKALCFEGDEEVYQYRKMIDLRLLFRKPVHVFLEPLHFCS